MRPKEWRDKIGKAHKGKTISQEQRDNQSRIMKLNYKNGFKSWNEGLTKETSPKLKRVGKNISRAKRGVPNPKVSKSLKKGFRSGKIKVWNKGLTSQTDDRVKKYSGENNGMYATLPEPRFNGFRSTMEQRYSQCLTNRRAGKPTTLVVG